MFSGALGQGVLEIVRMFSVSDSDHHLTCKTLQLIASRVRYHSDRELRRAPCHGSAMLECEAAAAPKQRSTHPLNRHVSARAFDAGAGTQHLARAATFEIAMKLFVDRHPTQAGVGFLVYCLRAQLDIKGSSGTSHHNFLQDLKWATAAGRCSRESIH